MKEKMSKEEQLREEQEDLFFKMMFAAFDKTDAPKYEALNEQLKNDPSNQESEEETQAMLDFIEQEIRKRDNELKKKEKHCRHVTSTLSKVLLVAILIMLLGGTAYGSIPSFRAMTQNLLLEASKVATRMAITDSSKRQERDEIVDGTEIVLLGYRFPGVPEGFRKTEERYDDTRAWVAYSDKNGGFVKYQVYRGLERDVALDTENAKVIPIEIHGYQGLMSIKDKTITVSWHDEERKAYIAIVTKGFADSFAFRIADEVEISEQN